jgi:hypothetical protein
MLAGVAAGKDEPADEFRVAQVRLNEGNSHGMRFQPDGRGLAKLTACLNVTPAPKLNRYAESAVLTFRVNEIKMLVAGALRAHETSLKIGQGQP